jgi:AbiV family abortive infection protein
MNREDTFRRAIDAILANSTRLLLDAQMLEFSEPPTTAVFLAQIAQEELAKAFLLCLVMRNVVPWHRHVLRATRDHTCKQLLGIVMDHVYPPDEQYFSRIERFSQTKEASEFPKKVADAIGILRHEKIGRWVSAAWVWAEDPEYDKDALAVAEGSLDKKKQDALYVRLGVPTKWTGQNASAVWSRVFGMVRVSPVSTGRRLRSCFVLCSQTHSRSENGEYRGRTPFARIRIDNHGHVEILRHHTPRTRGV